MSLYITQSQEMGREVRTHFPINTGVILFEAELLVLSPEDTVKVNETDLQYYTFKYNETQDCLVLGHGEIFNHSPNPNVGYRLVEHPFADRKLMQFFALREIEQGEQCFIDYAADAAINPAAYNVNLVG